MCEEPNPNLLFINFICFFFFYVNTALILNFKPIEIHHGLKLAQENKDYLPSNFHNQQCLKHVFVLCLSMKLVLWFKIFSVFVCEFYMLCLGMKLVLWFKIFNVFVCEKLFEFTQSE